MIIQSFLACLKMPSRLSYILQTPLGSSGLLYEVIPPVSLPDPQTKWVGEGFGTWLDGCKYLYLDLGTNRGELGGYTSVPPATVM